MIFGEGFSKSDFIFEKTIAENREIHFKAISARHENKSLVIYILINPLS